MDQIKPKPSKRLDLQGIRALAIIVVLGFHFFPEYCPNGYLGVDQFFVLSGFLMCMLLKRAENQSPCSLITIFYCKRFKRILPLYLLIILISMICLYKYFPNTAIETNQESAIHALLFVSNRPKTDQEDYFQQLSLAVDIFTHTWSLSVEIQFYFLVPFIFMIASKIPNKFQYFYYFLIGALSFTFFYISPPTEAFNSVFARIWQFLIGMIVYLLTNSSSKTEAKYKSLNNEEEEEGECKKLLLDEERQEVECCPNEHCGKLLKIGQKSSYLLLVVLLTVTSYPLVLVPEVVRPLITIGTGLLMLISDENLVLSNPFLTYIGDISYSLYLIHWPTYAYWKLTCDGDRYLLVCALLLSIILAIITFETYEKWYLKLSSTSIGLIVVLLFIVNVVVINKNEITDQMDSIGGNVSNLDNVTENMTLDDAARLNHRWSIYDRKFLRVPSCVYETKSHLGWCRHTGLSPSGKYKIAIIGNSWAANHARMFSQECEHKAKSIMQGAAYGCEPLYPSGNSELCKGNFTHFEERIRKEQPDYAFIFTRFMSIGAPFPKHVTSFDQDPIYQIMKEQMLKFISNIKLKLYILDSIPRINRKVIEEIVPLIRNHTSLETIDNLLIKPDNFEMARKRNAQLVKDCNGKCVLVDYLPEFFNNSTKTFRYFDDRGFSYWTDPLHLSPHGIEHIRHSVLSNCSEGELVDRQTVEKNSLSLFCLSKKLFFDVKSVKPSLVAFILEPMFVVLLNEFYLISDWIHNCFNCYAAFPDDQKDILRRNFYFQFINLESGFKSCRNRRNDVWFMPSGDFIDCVNLENFFTDPDEQQPISPEEAVGMFGSSFAAYHRNVSIPMIRDNVDFVEFMTLATLTLFATGIDGQSEVCYEECRKVRDTILKEIIHYYQTIEDPEEAPIRMCNILSFLPNLERSSRRFQEDIELRKVLKAFPVDANFYNNCLVKF